MTRPLNCYWIAAVRATSARGSRRDTDDGEQARKLTQTSAATPFTAAMYYVVCVDLSCARSVSFFHSCVCVCGRVCGSYKQLLEQGYRWCVRARSAPVVTPPP